MRLGLSGIRSQDQRSVPGVRKVPAGGVNESVPDDLEDFWMDYGGGD